MMRVWFPPVLMVLCGTVAGGGQFSGGNTGWGVVLLLVFLAFAGVCSPLLFPRSTDAGEAQRRSAADGRPVVFWRPGCTYCIRLRLRLGRDGGRAYWVNIWRDPAAAAVVRAANDGNETVPTVFVAGRPHTNPDPAWVRGHLRSSA